MGFIALIITLLGGYGYNNGWLGMVYAGLIYSYYAVLLSSIPTLLLGLPISLLVKKYNVLEDRTILLGAAILGALFLSFTGMFFFDLFDKELFFFLIFIGALGGLLNGYIFKINLKPNKNKNFTPSARTR